MATTQSRSTAVGVFHDRATADRAIQDLKKAGFRDDQIGYAMKGDSAAGSAGAAGGERITTDTGPGSGAASGAMTGGLLGALAGAAASLLIPGVGPVVAAGILGPILGGAAGGAALGAVGGGIIGGLTTTGVAEHEAAYYDAEFKKGGIVVTVQAADRYTEADAILRRHNASFYSAGSTSASTTHAADTRGAIRVPEIEERLDVQKREVQQGEVRIQKHVEERTETVPVTLEREEVHVERREVAERPIAPGEKVEAFRDETIRVPVRGEEATVTKQAVVTGEVVVDKDRHAEREQVSDTVRKTHVEVDKSTTDTRDARDTRNQPKR